MRLNAHVLTQSVVLIIPASLVYLYMAPNHDPITLEHEIRSKQSRYQAANSDAFKKQLNANLFGDLASKRDRNDEKRRNN